ncbi:MAG: dienelactone hydrolase family protein [Acidobacteria bacterium]|nr:dienelactone hydrolase family protein [Acidobacteriota bacterium]
MCDRDHFDEDLKKYVARGGVTRREFGAVMGAGMLMMLPQVPNPVAVTENDVEVRTPDGMADCYFVHPRVGAAAGVLVWPDVMGLRPAFRQMGRRLAESGYSVLVVNPFYRQRRAPVVQPGATFNDPAVRDTVLKLAQGLSAQTHVTDARAFVAWLDSQPAVDRNRRIGTQGYCMGGPIVFRTAFAVPDRIGAAVSFHGGGLVTDAPDSPHRQAATSKAQFLIAIAENDDERAPNEKNVLRETFANAKLQAEIEVYAGAAHGWCPPDSAVYNEPQAERAWSRLLALYSRALA